MKEDLRGFVKRLEEKQEILTIEKEVDPRYIAALLSQTDKAVKFNNIKGDDIPVIGGLAKNRSKIAIALNCKPEEVLEKVSFALRNPLPSVITQEAAPCQEIVKIGEEVDLTSFPIVLQHEKDGGPYISAGVQFMKDAKGGINAGIYRQMYRTPNTTGINLSTSSDLRTLYSKALEENRPLEMAVALGLHPLEQLAAVYPAPTGFEEMSFAGALHGEAVKLVKCKTIDVLVPADAEIILECEILPTGWVHDEGGYGELHGIMGEVKYNPIVKVKAITHRTDAMWHTLESPTEVYALRGPELESSAMALLESVRLRPKSVYATPGGSTFFEMIVSLKNSTPGEGKAAIMALLTMMSVKFVTVVDDDINIFDREDVAWAMSLRTQPDKDVIIIPGCQGKHLDPSIKAWTLPKGQLPTTAKMGIDATIPAGVLPRQYDRISYAYADKVNLDDFISLKRSK